MKSIKARLKHRFSKLMAMDKEISSSSSTNRMSRSTNSRRNGSVHRNPQRSDELPNPLTVEAAKHRLFWNARRNSSVSKVSKPDLPAIGGIKKKIPPQTRQSTFTQTEVKPKRKTLTKSSKCNSMAPTERASKDTLRPGFGNRKRQELTARCSASHEGRKILQERLMVQVDALFNMLFSASPFLQNFHERRKSTDLRMGTWTRNANGQNERVVSMTVALQANLGPKVAKVTETQTMRECSQPGQLYSIDVRSVNAEIPYADAFVVLLHFCLRATVEEYTDVLVFAQIKFLKSVWAVVKAFIEKNAYAGLEEFCQSLYSALLTEIKKM
ncbi:protein Aster-B isoform X2 [Drosophila ficusphila]|uniref:protein Aster-B isoform X2 n=1 Tax=Drosophila ficusphila TaxID=30025 RepID=UPI0007E6525D|nr:protein Aster-B isoform X2 [Drosophila ficusphila]